MNLTIRFLGAEVLHVSTNDAEQQQPGSGDATSMPLSVGFTNQWQGHGNEEDR